MKIIVDDLSGTEIGELLAEHMTDMKSISPPESRHALDLEGLKKPEITFWTVWEDDKLVACGALKELSATQGEIKSMRTSTLCRGKGVGSFILEHILAEARKRGYERISLETGSMSYFLPARALYKKYGFQECSPFSSYKLDPNSVYMTKSLMVEDD